MSANRLYRCYNCANAATGARGVDFVAPADAPACPTCGARHGDPATGRLVEPLAVIHYEAPNGVITQQGNVTGPVGTGYIACDPAQKTGQGTVVYTGEPTVVNCPACRQTDAWKGASKARIDPRFDLPMNIKPGVFDVQFAQNPEGISLKPPPGKK